MHRRRSVSRKVKLQNILKTTYELTNIELQRTEEVSKPNRSFLYTLPLRLRTDFSIAVLCWFNVLVLYIFDI